MKKHARFQIKDRIPEETPGIRAIATKVMSDKIKALDTWLRSLWITEENLKEYTIKTRVNSWTFDYEVSKGEVLLGKKTF